MKELMVVLCAVLAIGATAAGGIAIVNASGPTDAELAADLDQVRQAAAACGEISGQFKPGSVIHAQAELCRATHMTTEAMLEQKRRSWFRGITLRYVVEGQPLPPPDAGLISEITAEMEQARQGISEAQTKAADYTGGLILALAKVEEQTHIVTLAMLQQRLMMAKYGVVPAMVLRDALKQDRLPLGQSVDDEGAL